MNEKGKSGMKNEKKQNYYTYPVKINELNIKPTDRVALIDGDGSNGVDNVALMKINAYEKRHGVKHVRLIKLKHQRKNRILGLTDESIQELYQVRNYDRIYCSFIFTRSKPVIEIVRSILPNAYFGGTGVDEYYPMGEKDLRAQPKSITQLPPAMENMYPDYELYKSEDADFNVAFWSNPEKYHVPKKEMAKILRSPNRYGFVPVDLEGNDGGSDQSIQPTTKTVEWFDKMAAENGLNTIHYRGNTRGIRKSAAGCFRRCLFCVVPVLEGALTPYYYGLLGVIHWVLPNGMYPTMVEIVELYRARRLLMRPHIFRDSKGRIKRIAPFCTISDNNSPADPTCLEKMDFMIANDISVNLNQGADARLLTAKKRVDADGTVHPSGDEICARLAKLQFTNFNGTAKQLHFSWDFLGVERLVMAGLHKLVHEYGLSYRNFTIYCLSGFNTTFEQDLERVLKLRQLRVDPFVMVFRNVDGSEGTNAEGEPHDWRLKHLARWTNNKYLFRATDWDNYEPYLAEKKKREEFEERRRKNGGLFEGQLTLFDIDVEFLKEEENFHNEEYDKQLDLFDWLTETYVLHA
jgi:hypothetical protein